MKNLICTVLLSFIFIAGASAHSFPNPLKGFKEVCLQGYSVVDPKEFSKTKLDSICDCQLRNFRYLIEKSRTRDFFANYQKENSVSEAHIPMYELAANVELSCFKDTGYMSEKAKEAKDRRARQ